MRLCATAASYYFGRRLVSVLKDDLGRNEPSRWKETEFDKRQVSKARGLDRATPDAKIRSVPGLADWGGTVTPTGNVTAFATGVEGPHELGVQRTSAAPGGPGLQFVQRAEPGSKPRAQGGRLGP